MYNLLTTLGLLGAALALLPHANALLGDASAMDSRLATSLFYGIFALGILVVLALARSFSDAPPKQSETSKSVRNLFLALFVYIVVLGISTVGRYSSYTPEVRDGNYVLVNYKGPRRGEVVATISEGEYRDRTLAGARFQSGALLLFYLGPVLLIKSVRSSKQT